MPHVAARSKNGLACPTHESIPTTRCRWKAGDLGSQVEFDVEWWSLMTIGCWSGRDENGSRRQANTGTGQQNKFEFAVGRPADDAGPGSSRRGSTLC